MMYADSSTGGLLFEHDPKISVLFDEHMNILDCNPEAVRRFGFSSNEAFREGFISLVLESIPAQPSISGQNVAPFHFRLARVAETGYEAFITELELQGATVLFDTVIKRIPYGSGYVISVYMSPRFRMEETARVLTLPTVSESERELHARLLLTVNEIATLLIEAGPETFTNAMLECLKIIGMAVDVDRAYLWQNFEKDDRLYCRQLYEWSGNAEPQQGKDFAISVSYDDMPYWKSQIEARKTINGLVRNMPFPEQRVLGVQNIKSLLILPMYINNHFWGFIGFDDCHEERTFSRVQEQVLESAGILMVSSIERNNMSQRSIDAWIEVMGHERLLHAVNDVARLLLGTGSDDFLWTVHRALKTLGDCAGADRVSIWRNMPDDTGALYSERLAEYNQNDVFDPTQPAPRISIDKLVPGWGETRHDVNITVESHGDRIRRFMWFEGCQSILLLPLNIQGDFWGFIALLHTRGVFIYNDTQKGILRSGGMLISSGVIRDEITQSLVEARENALASARSKSEFLSRMSHEIRTPMNAIIGMTTLAKKSNDMAKVNHFLEVVDASSQQLLGIINDVLDMSKIDANKLEIFRKDFSFEEMIRHVINVVQVKLNEKKLDLRLVMPQTFKRAMNSDELRLSQVLINLLSNAIKFTPDYGVITLRVQEQPIDADHSTLRLEVIDTGIGIKEENLLHIFESFEQGDGSVTRQFGGTGLGLAICKRIVNLMGGEIKADSELGKGSCFTVDVEVEWGNELPHAFNGSSLREGMRILVVDDAPDVREYFKNTLESFRQYCDIAENGLEAVKRVEECIVEHKPYDVIFLDWYMPLMNGSETAMEIRHLMGNGVMVVMISSTDWSDIEQSATAAGVRHYLPKPILPSDLYNKLIELTGAADAVRAEADSDIAVYDWNGQCVLLAEDIEINREIIAGILEDTGITIDNAENGREVVDMFTANPSRYKLILMDVQMPVLDGLNATRAIRASGVPGAKSIPIIAMTANAFKEDEQAALAAGMNGHIAKPIDVPTLMNVLKNILV